jgi:2-amino-4-hydroxy-6-hydroxymethyldihydropteridine diphosphokinase
VAVCFVSIGSNVERERHIREAIGALRQHFGPLLLSPIYETEAVGFAGDPFFNLVAAFASDAPAADIAATLDDIERAHGRVRGGERFGPRVLDLDLLLVGDVCDASLRLPRAEIQKYAFVLKPLADIAPDLVLPGTGVTVVETWRALNAPTLGKTISVAALIAP